MNINRTSLLLLILTCLAQATCLAGNLQPATSPGSTMKTLSQVEPRTLITSSDLPLTITSPGSYYLAEDLTYSQSTGSAIIINTSKVTIDFNGFSLTGQGPTSDPANHAISSDVYKNPNFCVIRNGRIDSFGGIAMNLGESTCVQNMTFSHLGSGGVYLSYGSTVHNCRFCYIGYNKRATSAGMVFSYMTTYTHMLIAVSSGTVTQNTIDRVYFKDGSITAITGTGLIAHNSIANVYSYTSDVIAISGSGTITGNAIDSLSGGTSVSFGVYGIFSYAGSVITGNTIDSLSTSSTQACGIYTYGDSVIRDNSISNFYCSGSAVSLYGIDVSFGDSLVENNSITSFAQNSYNVTASAIGIKADSPCTLKSNHISDLNVHSGKVIGISLSGFGSSCRVTDNYIGGNLGGLSITDYGILVQTSDNVLLSNIVLKNADDDIRFSSSSKNNYYAANLTTRAITDLAPSGNNTSGTMPGANTLQ